MDTLLENGKRYVSSRIPCLCFVVAIIVSSFLLYVEKSPFAFADGGNGFTGELSVTVTHTDEADNLKAAVDAALEGYGYSPASDGYSDVSSLTVTGVFTASGATEAASDFFFAARTSVS